MFLSTSNNVQNSNFNSVVKRDSNPKHSSLLARFGCVVLSIGAAFQGLSPIASKISLVGTKSFLSLAERYQSSLAVGTFFFMGVTQVRAQNETEGSDDDFFDFEAIYNKSKSRWIAPKIKGGNEFSLLDYREQADIHLRPSLNPLPEGWAIFMKGVHPGSLVVTLLDEGYDGKNANQIAIFQDKTAEIYSTKSVPISDAVLMTAWSMASGLDNVKIMGQLVSSKGTCLGTCIPLVVKSEGHQLLRDMVKLPDDSGFIITWETVSPQALSKGTSSLKYSSARKGAGISLQAFDNTGKPKGPEVAWKAATSPELKLTSYAFPRLARFENSGDIVLTALNARKKQIEQQMFSSDLQVKGELLTIPVQSSDTMPAMITLSHGGGAIVWTEKYSFTHDIMFQRYDSQNQVNGTAQILSGLIPNLPDLPEIVATENGGTAVLFQSERGIAFYRLDRDGHREKLTNMISMLNTSQVMVPSFAYKGGDRDMYLTSYVVQRDNISHLFGRIIVTDISFESKERTSQKKYTTQEESSSRQAEFIAAVTVISLLCLTPCVIAIGCYAKKKFSASTLTKFIKKDEANDIPLDINSRAPLLNEETVSSA